MDSLNSEFFFRYAVLFFLNILFFSDFFSSVFVFLFVKLLSYFFSFFFSLQTVNSLFFVEGTFTVVEIAKECVAPFAYLFLSFFFLSLPLRFFNSLKLLVYSLVFFTFFNFLRIAFLSFLLLEGMVNLFHQVHSFFYYFFTCFFLLGLCFFFYKGFKISGIPFYDDFTTLSRQILKERK
ncbi:MAG: hypothetical protein KC548_04000 [Nanoarchaeota archaeon]|nr:hypothetical protein [Nanoarchaeota archaeon]